MTDPILLILTGAIVFVVSCAILYYIIYNAVRSAIKDVAKEKVKG